VGEPDQPRDRIGRWTSGGGAAIKSSFKSAAERIRAVDLKGVVTEERVKGLVTLAVQNALARMSHVDDPIADSYVEHQVNMLAGHLNVTAGHARNMMIAAVRKARAMKGSKGGE
jgi:RecA/RadA recombinase